jgi:hypothetical protein
VVVEGLESDDDVGAATARLPLLLLDGSLGTLGSPSADEPSPTPREVGKEVSLP